jgi:hypothetical protein
MTSGLDAPMYVHIATAVDKKLHRTLPAKHAWVAEAIEQLLLCK